jgi:ElaA protein
VVVKQSMRGTGLGRALVARGLEYLDTMRNGHPIKISSQLYLKDFYASFGFSMQGEPYIEDLIPHIAMIKTD